MNRLSRRPLLLLLVYVFAAILLTLLIIRNQSRSAPPEPRKHEASVHSPDQLGPHELFFVDRNYPDWNASPLFF